MEKNRRELQRLRKFKGVDDVCLDFGIRWRETFTHTDSLPRELITMAGALGISIELSHYPISTVHPHRAAPSHCPECGHEGKR